MRDDALARLPRRDREALERLAAASGGSAAEIAAALISDLLAAARETGVLPSGRRLLALLPRRAPPP